MPDFGKALKQLRDRDRQPYLSGLSPVTNFSLSTQLQFLKSRSMRTYIPTEPRVREALPTGGADSTPFGSHYTVRKSYGSTCYHGKVRLSRFSTLELQNLMQLMNQ